MQHHMLSMQKQRGLTSGISPNEFGLGDYVNLGMISAFIFRSLGYDGLSYDQEIQTARNLGIINSYDELKSSWVTRGIGV